MYRFKVGGILSIVSGGIGCFYSIIWLIMVIFMSAFMRSTMPVGMPYDPDFDIMFSMMITFHLTFASFMLLASILAIAGGVFALKRRNWGLSLAGSIASIVAFFPCGIASLIFIIQGKDEFQASSDTVTTT